MHTVNRFSDVDDEVIYRAQDEAETIAYRPAALTQQTQNSHSQYMTDNPHPAPCRRKMQNRRNEMSSNETSTDPDGDETVSSNRGTQDENNAFAALEALAVNPSQTNDEAKESSSALRKDEDIGRIERPTLHGSSGAGRSAVGMLEESIDESCHVPERRSVASLSNSSPPHGLSETDGDNRQREEAPISPSSTMKREKVPVGVNFVHNSLTQSRDTICSRRIRDTSSGRQRCPLMPENRRFAMPKQNTRTGQTESSPSSMQVRTTRTKHSIVGSIPQHWDIRKKNSAGACSFSHRLKPPLRHPLSLASMTNHTPPPKRVTVNETIVSPKESALSMRSSPVSFVPPFLSTPIALELPIDDTDHGFAFGDGLGCEKPVRGARTGSPSRPLTSPPAKRRRIGALVTRLQKIRTEILGDVIRFQSGQYPFRDSKATFDMNDPRCRAHSYMDVTVIGAAIESGEETMSSAKMLQFLGHVHSHVEASVPSHAPCHCLVWLVFTVERARAVSVQHGSTLRIYNAVPIAVPGPVEWAVICTELCETYPSNVLDALEPTASEILSNLQLPSSPHL